MRPGRHMCALVAISHVHACMGEPSAGPGLQQRHHTHLEHILGAHVLYAAKTNLVAAWNKGNGYRNIIPADVALVKRDCPIDLQRACDAG